MQIFVCVCMCLQMHVCFSFVWCSVTVTMATDILWCFLSHLTAVVDSFLSFFLSFFLSVFLSFFLSFFLSHSHVVCESPMFPSLPVCQLLSCLNASLQVRFHQLFSLMCLFTRHSTHPLVALNLTLSLPVICVRVLLGVLVCIQ